MQLIEYVWCLYDNIGGFVVDSVDQCFQIIQVWFGNFDFDVGIFCQCFGGFDIVWVCIVGYDGFYVVCDMGCYYDCFGIGCGVVIYGGIGYIYVGQLGDLGLEFKQGLQGVL